MPKKKITYTSIQLAILSLCLSLFEPLLVTEVNAQQVRNMQQYYKVERNYGSRLGSPKNRICKSCKEEETRVKVTYLERVISEGNSSSYQAEIESMIFSDAKFVNGCWKKAIDNGMDFFFTIDESGETSDFAWFPKQRAGKCIKRHISKIEFPSLEKPHHSWLVASEVTQ